MSTDLRWLVLAPFVVGVGARMLRAQNPADSWSRFTIAAGPALRDTRDYETARKSGIAASFGYEESIGGRSSVAIDADVAGFQDEMEPVTIVALSDRLGTASRDAARSFSWNPGSGSHGHSNLALLGADVRLRQYLQTYDRGPYVGADVGVVELLATDQSATRPAAGALAGYRWKMGRNVRAFAEARFVSAAFDTYSAFNARSPRWAVTSLVGATISR